jgi:GNAT superfamily N-acetyltransferase
MTFRIEVVARGRGMTSDSENSTVAAWRRELFADDRDIVESFTWQSKDGMGIGIHAYDGEEFAGFAHVFPRVGRLDDRPLLMGCLGSVMTAKAHQGRGIGTAVVTTAGDLILKTLQVDLGVLVCKKSLVPFYARLGWQRFPDPVAVAQPDGNIPWPFESMVLPREVRGLIRGKLDLCGLPF